MGENYNRNLALRARTSILRAMVETRGDGQVAFVELFALLERAVSGVRSTTVAEGANT